MTAPSRPVVLVGLADALAAVETVWSLRDNGFDVLVAVRVGTRPAVCRVRGIRTVPVRDPARDLAGCVADLALAVRQQAVSVVLPLDDQMVLLAGELRALTGVPVRPYGPDRVAVDKRLQIELAAKAGLPVPDTVVVEQDGDWDGAPPLPFVAKPALAVERSANALDRQGSAVCVTARDVAAARRALRPPLLLQPLLAGVGEGVFGLADRTGEVTAWSGHRRVRMMNPQGSGASTSVSVEVPEDLRAAVQSFVAAAEWVGLFMVELLRDGAGTPWFMELNGRAWGSMALATRRGYAYPAWTVQDALGRSRTPALPLTAPTLRCRHLGREAVHLGFVLRGPSVEGAVWPTPVRTLAAMARWNRSDRVYNWRSGEPTVLLADTWQTVAGQLRRLRGRR